MCGVGRRSKREGPYSATQPPHLSFLSCPRYSATTQTNPQNSQNHHKTPNGTIPSRAVAAQPILHLQMLSGKVLFPEIEYELEDWELGVNSRRRSQSFASSIADSEPDRVARGKVEFDITDIVLKSDFYGDHTTIKLLEKYTFFGYEDSPKFVNIRFLTAHRLGMCIPPAASIFHFPILLIEQSQTSVC